MNNGALSVPQASVEEGLLASINQRMECWLEVSAFDIEDFTQRREIFLFFQEYLSQYGNLPSDSQLSSRFQWQPPIGDFRYWLDEMKRYSLIRKIGTVLLDGNRLITRPMEALDFMLQNLSMIKSLQTNHMQATDAGALSRLEKFDLRTKYIFDSKTQLGLPTGMHIIDNSLIGWMPGDLIGIYSRPGVGKTWWLAWQLMQSWVKGHRTLFISPEIPANRMNLRIDLLAANAIGHPIDYNKLMVGDPSIRDEYALTCQVLSQSNRWWTYSDQMGLSDIAALIRQHSPEIVAIDGISLLTPPVRRQGTWEEIKALGYGLKTIATNFEIPILISHQAVNSARGRRTEPATVARGDDFKMPDLNDAAYGDAFVAACSDVITMCGDPESVNINWYSLRKYRERGWTQNPPARMAVAVDFAKGKIIDLSPLGQDKVAVGEESRRLLGL